MFSIIYGRDSIVCQFVDDYAAPFSMLFQTEGKRRDLVLLLKVCSQVVFSVLFYLKCFEFESHHDHAKRQLIDQIMKYAIELEFSDELRASKAERILERCETAESIVGSKSRSVTTPIFIQTTHNFWHVYSSVHGESAVCRRVFGGTGVEAEATPAGILRANELGLVLLPFSQVCRSIKYFIHDVIAIHRFMSTDFGVKMIHFAIFFCGMILTFCFS
jgi:hypothetical protein